MGYVIRVVLVDDQELMRVGFRMVLGAQDDMEIVGEAGNGEEAVRLAEELRPDVVLMDVRMPVLDGIEATRRLLADPTTSCRVLVLTTYDLDEYVFDALKAGASGFLLKDAPPEQVFEAVRVVAAGEALLDPSVTRRLITEFAQRPQRAEPREVPALRVLTDREREVLGLVGRGFSNVEIAQRLVVSPATAKTHVARILSKLQARDRAQLVVLAYESGLVRPGAP